MILLFSSQLPLLSIFIPFLINYNINQRLLSESWDTQGQFVGLFNKAPKPIRLHVPACNVLFIP